MKPEGSSIEGLTLALYGEDGQTSTTYTEVKRIRQLVPVERSPFRLGLEYSADFVHIKGLIQRGDLRGALSLYHGALLPQSKAPLIEEERQWLEEALRGAVLRSGDPEVAYRMAEVLRDDLEVWQYAAQRLNQIDPRRALAQARLRQIEREWGLN